MFHHWGTHIASNNTPHYHRCSVMRHVLTSHSRDRQSMSLDNNYINIQILMLIQMILITVITITLNILMMAFLKDVRVALCWMSLCLACSPWQYHQVSCACVSAAWAHRQEDPWLRTNWVNTNGTAAKVLFDFTDWGKRCALALLGRQTYIHGSTH